MSEQLAQVKRDNDYLDEQEREVRRRSERGANRCCPQNAGAQGSRVRADRSFAGVFGLKCGVFLLPL